MSFSAADARAVREMVAGANRFFQLGVTEQGFDELAKIERQFGPTYEASLASIPPLRARGDAAAALDAVNFAILSRPTGDPVLNRLIRTKAEILIDMGRPTEARRLLRQTAGADKTAAYFRMLRNTMQTEADIAEYEEVAAPSFVAKKREGLHALHYYSMIQRDFGLHGPAQRTMRERFLRATRNLAFGSQPKVQSETWAREAAVALADIHADLQAAGIEMFLISGVFLGAYRENTILGHDRDLDVGVDERVSMQELLEVVRASNRFIVRPIESENSVYLTHLNGVNVDVFRHFMREGRYVHEGIKVFWWNTPFALVWRDFLGGSYRVPDDAELYLTENYGDWRTPAPEFETFVDTPNMVIVHNDHMVWYFLLKLTDYYLMGKLPQFTRVWTALSDIYEADPVLAATAQAVMDGNLTGPKKKKPASSDKPNAPADAVASLLRVGNRYVRRPVLKALGLSGSKKKNASRIT